MIDIGYFGAVFIFAVGVLMSLSVVVYVVFNYYRYKGKDAIDEK